MTANFFDTSALVKRHVRETGSAWVRSLTGSKSASVSYIARITAVEMVAALARRQRGGSLSAMQTAAILGHFRRHLVGRYRILEVTPAILTDAMQRARSHGLRAYDAVQLASALEVHRLRRAAGLDGVVLISADQELNAAALAEGMAVDDPNRHP